MFVTEPDPTLLQDAARLFDNLWVPISLPPRIGPDFSVEDIKVFQGAVHFAGEGFVGGPPDPPVGPIERLVGGQWELLDSYEQFDTRVHDMDEFDSKLFVGGEGALLPPSDTNDTFVSAVHTWDGADWVTPGVAVGGTVRAFAVWDEHIYAGGGISNIGGRPATDLTRFGPFCAADLTGSSDPNDKGRFGVPNGIVDSDDFFYFLDLQAASSPKADIDNDGDVDSDDFFAFLDLFNAGCP